jgi:hypothetical protein
MLTTCNQLYKDLSVKYPTFTLIGDEVICFAHGLRTSASLVRAYVRGRVEIDIGAFNGDSAVVLMDFAKVIYNFESSLPNFKKLTEAIKMHKNYHGSGHAF